MAVRPTGPVTVTQQDPMRHRPAYAAILAIFSAFAISAPARADGQGQPPRLELSIKQGIVMVLENNLDITIERISPQIAEAGILTEQGAFDVEIFGSARRRDAETPLSTRASVAADGLSTIKSETVSLYAGIEGRTTIGTVYTLETRNEATSDTLSGFTPEYGSFTGVTVTQPLLKGFGAGVNKLRLNSALKDRDISVNRLRQMITDTVARFASVYWDLAQAKAELGVRVESEELALSLAEINRKKLEAGAASALEVTQARAAASVRKDGVITAQRALRERENELKLLISGDVYALRDTEIVTGDPGADRSLAVENVETLEDGAAEALRSRPDYLVIRDEIEKSNLQVLYANGQRYPKVDLEASYGFNGLGGSFRESYSGIDSNPEWTVGLVMRYPLGNRASLGALKAARLRSGVELLRLKKLEQSIILSLDGARKEIETARARVEAARVSTALTRESMEAEEKKLAAGRSTTYSVLLVQEDLAMARLNEIGAVIDYNKALISYLREKGTLLEGYGFEMEKAGVERLARRDAGGETDR